MSDLDRKREEITAHIAGELGFTGIEGLSLADRAIIELQTMETIEACDPTSPKPADCSDADRQMRKLLAEYHALQRQQGGDA